MSILTMPEILAFKITNNMNFSKLFSLRKKDGFALIEVLIAITILSIILLSVYSGLTSSIKVISGAKNHTTAMVIARSKLNEFRMNLLREPDISRSEIEEYDNFSYSRTTTNFDNPLLDMMSAKRTEITVFWRENDREKKYSISIIYISN